MDARAAGVADAALSLQLRRDASGAAVGRLLALELRADKYEVIAGLPDPVWSTTDSHTPHSQHQLADADAKARALEQLAAEHEVTAVANTRVGLTAQSRTGRN